MNYDYKIKNGKMFVRTDKGEIIIEIDSNTETILEKENLIEHIDNLIKENKEEISELEARFSKYHNRKILVFLVTTGMCAISYVIDYKLLSPVFSTSNLLCQIVNAIIAIGPITYFTGKAVAVADNYLEQYENTIKQREYEIEELKKKKFKLKKI